VGVIDYVERSTTLGEGTRHALAQRLFPRFHATPLIDRIVVGTQEERQSQVKPGINGSETV
jgi:hypothetical protein